MTMNIVEYVCWRNYPPSSCCPHHHVHTHTQSRSLSRYGSGNILILMAYTIRTVFDIKIDAVMVHVFEKLCNNCL